MNALDQVAQKNLPPHLIEYLLKEKKKAMQPDNVWFAGQVMGHSPSEHECIIHWLCHRRREQFRAPHNLPA